MRNIHYMVIWVDNRFSTTKINADSRSKRNLEEISELIEVWGSEFRRGGFDYPVTLKLDLENNSLKIIKG